MNKYQSPKEYISHVLSRAIEKLKEEQQLHTPPIAFDIETKPNREIFGDFSSNAAFALAPYFHKKPFEIAQEIVSYMSKDAYIEDVRVAGGGFVNVYVPPSLFLESFEVFSLKKFGIPPLGKGKRIIVEFSSPNVAKPFHVGHLRNTILGEFLSRLYERMGHRVIRWNHLGDWGTQFGKLIVAFKKWGNRNRIKEHPITEMLALYVRFTKAAEEDPSLEQEAREEFNKLERGDTINKGILRWFMKETLKEIHQTYKQFDVHFDVVKGESYYIQFKEKFFAMLRKKGLIEESEGAKIIRLSDSEDSSQMPPVLLEKSDGATLYHTRDLLSLQYREKKYAPDSIIYVVGNEQSLYLSQMFAAAKKIGLSHAHLMHVAYGLVFGPGKKKLSTREGNIITANELIKDTLFKAAAVIHEKHPDIQKRPPQKLVEYLAIGAIKYNMLRESRLSEVTFDFDRMLSFAGNSSPYLQYTYARLGKIVSKSGKFSLVRAPRMNLRDPDDISLIKKMLEFPEALKSCYESSSSHFLTEYLYTFANLLNSFYEKHPILKDDDVARRRQRVYLLHASTRVLKEGLDLLGIHALKEI